MTNIEKMFAANNWTNRLFSSLLLLIAILAYFHPQICSANEYKIYTEEYPPYNYTQNGKITGISTDIVREILRRIGHKDEITLTSWSYAYRQTLEKDNIILFSTTRAPFRENLFKWVGPLVPNNTVLFARSSSGMTIKKLDDAKSVGNIGVYKDDYGELLLKEKGFTNLRSVQDNKLNLEDLVYGKIDLWIINELTGNQMAREMGLNNKIKKVFDVQKEFMYLAFSKNTPDAIITQWQQALDEIKSDGTYAQIFSKWIMFSLTEDLKPVQSIQLNNEERNFLSKHPVINMAPDPAWPPIEFYDSNGSYKGMTADYMALLENKLDITFSSRQLKNWESVLSAAKDRQIDIISAAVPTAKRKAYLSFSKPYLHMPAVIVVDGHVKGSLSMADLKGKRVSVVSGYSLHDYMKENYPEIIIDPVVNTLEGLRKVSFGKSYAMVENVATTSYLIEQEIMPNLRIAGESGYTFNLAVATRKDWPLLNSIFNKALNSITAEERQTIYRKWVPIKDKPWITVKVFFIGLIIVLGIVFIVGIVVWNFQLSATVNKRTQELRASKENFKNLYKTALVGLFRASIDGSKVYSANPAFAKLFGYKSDGDVIRHFIPTKIYVDKNQHGILMEKLLKTGKVEEYEFIGQRLDGNQRDFLLNAYLYRDEGYIEGAILDITERKKKDEIIRKLAMTDPLTGLSNRNQFNTKLDEAIAYSKRFKKLVGLLLIDLDDFKPVNDLYGHPVGDKLLIHVAKELTRNFREVDTAARMGGDEFAIILNGINSKADAKRLAESVLERITSVVNIDQHDIRLGASMGLCFYPDDASDIELMLHNADKALYKAKALGKNQIYLFDPVILKKSVKHEHGH